ncbi:MAG: alpha/beta fold hydrolase [Jiangellaceae bacterium]
MSTPPFLSLPEGVRAARIATSRGEFAVLEAGSSGPTVLLVPGWTGSKEDFVAMLAPLAADGYHAVAYDQRGQFETPGSESEDEYALPSLGADLLAVADEVAGAPTHVFAHSFGGMVARAAALADQDAFASLTLMCSGPGPQPADRHDLLRALAAAIPAYGLDATWQAKRAYERSQGAPEPPPEIESFMQRRFLANHPASLRAITLHLTTAEDTVDALAATGLPVLVAFGADDDGWPQEEQREMAARLGALVAVVDGAGHSPAAERPTETVAMLERFLATVPEHSRRIGA